MGCVLATIGLGCVVKHVAMNHADGGCQCGCMQKFKEWKSGKQVEKEEETTANTTISALDVEIERYAHGEITRAQFDEIKKNLV